MTEREKEIKEQIYSLVNEYYKERHAGSKAFIPGETRVNYGGRFFDEREMLNLIDASLDFWLTAGPWANKLERHLAEWLGIKYCSLVNSGSSANLLAFMALTSQELGEKRIKREDEVITVAAGFPTTISPIVLYGATPVFVDIDIPSYNINIEQLKEAFSDKTKAVMIAHTLGNPFNLKEVKSFCDLHNLWLIEDNCDALGSEYYWDGDWKKTGTIGHIGTSSFYPPHHLTMGEGGAVYTNDPLLHRLVNSFRDWGRDCWCMGGVDNTCKHRFDKQFGELPIGYDHKYVYSHFGYNLKITDLQAAIGCAQLDKLDYITETRRKNFNTLKTGLEGTQRLILPEPQPDSNPSWFGFLVSVREDAGFTRNELSRYLESKKIQTRNLFAGNILKHPAFDEMRTTGKGYRVVGDLKGTDFVMNNTFWIGVYPGMTEQMLSYMIETIKEFVNKHS
jgi:CDP-6-deoxy-D-xylo-4-hexulose-3-dehydrase